MPKNFNSNKNILKALPEKSLKLITVLYMLYSDGAIFRINEIIVILKPDETWEGYRPPTIDVKRTGKTNSKNMHRYCKTRNIFPNFFKRRRENSSKERKAILLRLICIYRKILQGIAYITMLQKNKQSFVQIRIIVWIASYIRFYNLCRW